MLRPAAVPNGSRAAKANENETKQPESNRTARPFDRAAAPSSTREIQPHNRCVVAYLRTSFTILRFHTPAHRTGLADFPHPALRLASLTTTRRLRCISVVTPRTSPSSMASKVLSVTAESLMELIGKANLRTLGLFQEHARSQAPFLDRHYPASTVVRACPPPQTAQPAPHGVPVERHNLSPLGFPVFPVIPCWHAVAHHPGEASQTVVQ